MAGDDEQPANARQGRDDVLDHAVDEVVLRGFSTQIQEWHNGEGWSFGKRWRMGRRVPDRGSRTIWGSASGRRPLFPDVADEAEPLRSEEHTSELQSLMRRSYAVFCVKKKTKTT